MELTDYVSGMKDRIVSGGRRFVAGSLVLGYLVGLAACADKEVKLDPAGQHGPTLYTQSELDAKMKEREGEVEKRVRAEYKGPDKVFVISLKKGTLEFGVTPDAWNYVVRTIGLLEDLKGRELTDDETAVVLYDLDGGKSVGDGFGDGLIVRKEGESGLDRHTKFYRESRAIDAESLYRKHEEPPAKQFTPQTQ